jgi:hypothetical protein
VGFLCIWERLGKWKHRNILSISRLLPYAKLQIEVYHHVSAYHLNAYIMHDSIFTCFNIQFGQWRFAIVEIIKADWELSISVKWIDEKKMWFSGQKTIATFGFLKIEHQKFVGFQNWTPEICGFETGSQNRTLLIFGFKTENQNRTPKKFRLSAKPNLKLSIMHFTQIHCDRHCH